MQDNELIEILKEFDEKRVGQLNDNARNLFYAIMSIADERDKLLEENQQLKADYGNKAQVERDLLLEENEQLKKEIKEYQEELNKADSITQSCIFDGAKESAISYRECLNELEKYEKLYENEKEHTDTLKKIIKEVKETLERHLTAKSYGNHKYELFGREYLEELLNLLDLLKEIK